MEYCDDVDCPKLDHSGDEFGSNCELGLNNRFQVPRSYKDIMDRSWGYKMPKACQLSLKIKRGLSK